MSRPASELCSKDPWRQQHPGPSATARGDRRQSFRIRSPLIVWVPYPRILIELRTLTHGVQLWFWLDHLGLVATVPRDRLSLPRQLWPYHAAPCAMILSA